MLAFHLTADMACVFFEICEELNLKTEDERLAVLKAMADKGLLKNIVETKKTKEEYLKHLSKHFNVCEIKEK